MEVNDLKCKYIKLRNQLIKILNNSDYEIDVAGDAIDKLQGESIIRVQKQISQNNLSKLYLLERAIKQIELGCYGYCEECDRPIGIKRLEAIPGCRLCISCAEKLR